MVWTRPLQNVFCCLVLLVTGATRSRDQLQCRGQVMVVESAVPNFRDSDKDLIYNIINIRSLIVIKTGTEIPGGRREERVYIFVC